MQMLGDLLMFQRLRACFLSASSLTGWLCAAQVMTLRRLAARRGGSRQLAPPGCGLAAGSCVPPRFSEPIHCDDQSGVSIWFSLLLRTSAQAGSPIVVKVLVLRVCFRLPQLRPEAPEFTPPGASPGRTKEARPAAEPPEGSADRPAKRPRTSDVVRS